MICSFVVPSKPFRRRRGMERDVALAAANIFDGYNYLYNAIRVLLGT